MPEHAPYELEGEGPGDIRVRTVSGERRLIKSAAGFLAATAAKAIPAFRALTVADLPSGLTGIDFLVGTATGNLSAEIVAGTTPGGELGGTWASPTVDTIHSGSAHHAQAHGASDHTDQTRSVSIPPSAMSAIFGTPDLAVRGSTTYLAWAFDKDVVEVIETWFQIPQDYVSGFAVNLYFTNLGAGSGNIVWYVALNNIAIAGNLASLGVTVNTATAPSLDALSILTHTATLPNAAAASQSVQIAIGRIGNDAADTLGNDAGLVGIAVSYTASG